MTGVELGSDGQARCPWGLSPPEYRDYHDLEWGRPVGDERAIFEKVCLEGFQAGLSWLTILRKREGFRRAFAGFDPEVVAGFDQTDVDRLLADPGIVRHRAKIAATVGNARAMLRMAGQGDSLAALFWRHRPGDRPAPVTTEEVPASTPESKALSGELSRLGFRFVGATTVYSAMQSLGLVNDHLAGCHNRSPVEEAQRAFRPPTGR